MILINIIKIINLALEQNEASDGRDQQQGLVKKKLPRPKQKVIGTCSGTVGEKAAGAIRKLQAELGRWYQGQGGRGRVQRVQARETTAEDRKKSSGYSGL